MTASFIELARNAKIATDVNASGIHTLKFIEAVTNWNGASINIQIPVDELAGL